MWASIQSFTRSLPLLRAILIIAGVFILFYGVISLNHYGITWDENKSGWLAIVVGASLIVSQIGSHLHDLRNPD